MGPSPPECDKTDLMHAVGSIFGGLMQSEIRCEFCRIKVVLNVHKSLRRGVFIQEGLGAKSWIPFKYKSLPGFCFGCGCMGHLIKDCLETLEETKN